MNEEERKVHDRSIHGIIAEFYGEAHTTTSRARESGEYFRGLAHVGAAHVREYRKLLRTSGDRESVSAGGVSSNEGAEAEAAASAEDAAIITWAKREGLYIERLPRQYEAYSQADLGAHEHHVFLSSDPRRVVKYNRDTACIMDEVVFLPDHTFGAWPEAKGDSWGINPALATAGRYLERIINCNALLSDDLVLVGVHVDEQGRTRIVTTQPVYEGELIRARGGVTRHREELQTVQQVMRTAGFLPANDRTYFRPEDSTAIFDAHPGNLMWVRRGDGSEVLMPFDVVVVTGITGRLWENLMYAAQRKP